MTSKRPENGGQALKRAAFYTSATGFKMPRAGSALALLLATGQARGLPTGQASG